MMNDRLIIAAIISCSIASMLLLLFLIIVGFYGFTIYEKSKTLWQNAIDTIMCGAYKWIT